MLATIEARERFSRPDLGLQFFRASEQAALSLPGVSSTALVGTLPGGRPMWQSVRVEPPQLPLRDVEMDVAAFTPRSLRRRRCRRSPAGCSAARTRRARARSSIVNEEAARDIFDGDAVGRSIEDPPASASRSSASSPRGRTTAAEPEPPTIYYYAEQTGTPMDQVGPARFRVPRACPERAACPSGVEGRRASST